jgi:hypothetical protein
MLLAQLPIQTQEVTTHVTACNNPTISTKRSFLNVYDAVIFNCSRHLVGTVSPRREYPGVVAGAYSVAGYPLKAPAGILDRLALD